MNASSYFPITLVLATVLMAGCSSSSNDDNDNPANGNPTDGNSGNSDGVSVWGTIILQQDSLTSGGTVSLSGGFLRLSGVQLPPASTFTELAAPMEDVCEVTTGSASDDIEIPDLDGLNFSFISAGDTITFTSPAGTYAELQRTELAGFTAYIDLVSDRPGPVPSGLTVDIPGADFPAFANVAIPDVQPLVVTSPTSSNFLPERVTADTTFTWEAGTNPDARILIDAFSFDFSSSESINLSCTVIDDGSFELPDAIKAELGSDFDASLDISRGAFAFEQRGDALLIITNES